MGHGHEAVEVAKTVLEVADLAWSAVEHLHHHENHSNYEDCGQGGCNLPVEELENVRKENRRLRELLEQNLKLLQNLAASPCFINDCPPDVCPILRFLSRVLLFECDYFVCLLTYFILWMHSFEFESF